MKGTPPATSSSRSDQTALARDSSTFAPGMRLLPADIRRDVQRLYNILRTLDDLVDEDRPEASQRVEAVEHWALHQPAEQTPETQALADLSQRHELPSQALLDFCRGMRHDIARATIHTEEDLETYCQQAGGSVGIMLARILGTSHPDCEAKMATLGRAMQRTNIIRDIDEDAAHGRLYIPRHTIERYGDPTPGKRMHLLRDQIARADALYHQATDATLMLARGRRAMTLSITLYRQILRQIERNGYGNNPERAVVPAWRRRLLIARHRLSLRQHS